MAYINSNAPPVGYGSQAQVYQQRPSDQDPFTKRKRAITPCGAFFAAGRCVALFMSTLMPIDGGDHFRGLF